MLSDRELLSAYLKGDEDAFEVFYERHRRQVFVFVLSFVGSREAAEEVHQEVFLGLLGRLERVVREAAGAGTDRFRPYLLRLARSRAIDFLRRERRGERAVRRRARDPLLGRPRDEAAGGGSGVDAEELERALDRLPVEQREAVVLRALAGLTFAEIASVADVPENTAVSRFRYGIEKLRASLGAVGVRRM